MTRPKALRRRWRVPVRPVFLAGMGYVLVISGYLFAPHALAASNDAAVASNTQITDSPHGSAVQQARDWLNQGQGKTAYELLAPLEPELAGDVEFDVLFGQAALQADRPSEAAFAFERCLAVQSANGTCRLGIARAHISLQEVASARAELATLSAASPSTQVQEVIASYLGLLSGEEAASQDSRLTSYVQLGVGYDSNINNASSRDSMALPLYQNEVFPLSREGQSQESGFTQGRFNISYSTPIAPHWRFLTEANVAATGNWDTHRYDTLVSDVSVGLARRANKHQFEAKVLGQNYRLGGHNYRNLFSVLGQYAYSVSDRAEVGTFVQASRLTYPHNRLRDANRYTLGASWTQGLASDRAVVYLSGYGGTEDTTRHHAPRQYDYTFAGARTGGMYLMTPRLQLEGGVSAERRRYAGHDELFLKARRDNVYNAYLGFNYAINRKLSLRPQYRYTHSDSNIVLHDYQRHVFTVNLRYELF